MHIQQEARDWLLVLEHLHVNPSGVVLPMGGNITYLRTDMSVPARVELVFGCNLYLVARLAVLHSRLTVSPGNRMVDVLRRGNPPAGKEVLVPGL